MSISAADPPAPTILLTNDDGLDPSHAQILPLAQALCRRGHDVVVVAPGRDNSACGQRITLGKPLDLRRHSAHEAAWGAGGSLAVFSLWDGTPADCVAVANEPRAGLLARLGREPRLCVSGVNMGQNLGNDVLYSGTFGAARQAAMFGLPALATSVDLFRARSGPEAESDAAACRRAVDAVAALAETALAALLRLGARPGRPRLAPADAGAGGEDAVLRAFARGDVVLNVNVPLEWDGAFATTRLDAVLHRGAVEVARVPGDEDPVQTTIGRTDRYQCDYMRSPGSDVVAVMDRKTLSVTPVSTWPFPHPLAMPAAVLEGVACDGLMRWMAPAEAAAGKACAG